MTTVTTTDEPRSKQMAAAVREERTGYDHAYREELAKRTAWATAKKKRNNGPAGREMPLTPTLESICVCGHRASSHPHGKDCVHCDRAGRFCRCKALRVRE